MDKFDCMILSWEEIVKQAKNASDLIKQSDFHPDVVIGISRGGLVPARLFCDFLHVKSCFTLKVDHWGLTATKDGNAKLTHPLNKDLTGLKVLLVDDITDSGQSIELAKEHILELNPKVVKTVTLYNLFGSKIKPDFFGEERSWAWMIFPWNFQEDMVNIIKKIVKDEKKEVEVIKEELNNNYNINLENNKIEEILKHMDYLDNLF